MITFSAPAAPSSPPPATIETDPVKILAQAMRRRYAASGVGPTDEELSLDTNLSVDEVRRLAPQARPIAAQMSTYFLGSDR